MVYDEHEEETIRIERGLYTTLYRSKRTDGLHIDMSIDVIKNTGKIYVHLWDVEAKRGEDVVFTPDEFIELFWDVSRGRF